MFLVIAKTLLLGSIWLSVFERWAHMFMHHPWGFARDSFGAHLRHHNLFPRGGPYRLEAHEELDLRVIQRFFPDFVGLFIVGVLPFVIVAVSYAPDTTTTATIIAVGVAETFGYYCLMEAIHWAAHTQEENIPKSKVLHWLTQYHDYHHDEGERHFNVVLPFGDWIHEVLGTVWRTFIWNPVPK